jgi:hypothetical protein
MIFCLGGGRYENKGEGYQKNYRIFNKDVSEEVFEKAYNSQPEFKLEVNKYGYKQAWQEAWKTASKEFKQWIKDLPNYDPEIFTKITGIDFKEGLSGKEVEVKLDGKVYKAIIQ